MVGGRRSGRYTATAAPSTLVSNGIARYGSSQRAPAGNVARPATGVGRGTPRCQMSQLNTVTKINFNFEFNQPSRHDNLARRCARSPRNRAKARSADATARTASISRASRGPVSAARSRLVPAIRCIPEFILASSTKQPIANPSNPSRDVVNPVAMSRAHRNHHPSDSETCDSRCSDPAVMGVWRVAQCGSPHD